MNFSIIRARNTLALLTLFYVAETSSSFCAEPTNRSDQPSVAVDISTDRGSSPVYREGEEMTVITQTSAAVNLYCFYMDGSGKISRIFPNRHHPLPSVASQSPLQIPNQGMSIRMDRPLTMSAIRCFATQSSPPVSPPLGPDLEALRIQSLDALTETVLNLAPDSVIATLVVTTTK